MYIARAYHTQTHRKTKRERENECKHRWFVIILLSGSSTTSTWYASKILLLKSRQKISRFRAFWATKIDVTHVALTTSLLTHARNNTNTNQNVFSLCRSICFHGIVCLSSIVAKIDQEIRSLVFDDREEHRVDGRDGFHDDVIIIVRHG